MQSYSVSVKTHHRKGEKLQMGHIIPTFAPRFLENTQIQKPLFYDNHIVLAFRKHSHWLHMQKHKSAESIQRQGFDNHPAAFADFGIAVFCTGILAGCSGIIPHSWSSSDISTIILYILVVQVGLSIGMSGNLMKIAKETNLTTILVPACTVVGSLAFAAMLSLFLKGFSATECMALGSGFGYYSLSSVLISEIKEPLVGAQKAAELGILALLANIFRELIAISMTPYLRRTFGRLSPVSAAGVTSMDVLLPTIVKYSGKETMPAALVNGIALEILTPLLVCYFASI